MPEYLAPGVYVEETSFRAKSIEGVSTSIAGMIGPARYGPVGGEPELITSFTEYERVFGGLDRLSFRDPTLGTDALEDPPTDAEALTEQQNYLAFAARAFFDNGGTKLYVTRIYGGSQGMPERWGHGRLELALSGSELVTLWSRFPGAAGNLQVRFEARVGGNVLTRRTNDDGTTTNTVRGPRRGDVVFIGRKPTGSPAADSTAITASDYGFYTVSQAADGSWQFEGDTTVPLASLLVDDDVIYPVSTQVFTRTSGDSDDEQRWGEFSFTPALRDSLTAYFHLNPEARRRRMTVPLAFVWPTQNVEDADDLTGAPTGHDLTSALFPDLAAALQLENEVRVRRADGAFTTPDNDTVRSVRLASARAMESRFTLEDGHDGLTPAPIEYEGEEENNQKTGFVALEDVEDISIVAAPGYSARYADDDTASEADAIQQLLIQHAERMRYRIAVLDAGPDFALADVRAQRGAIDSTRAALYYPWIRVVDPLAPRGTPAASRELLLPPSGFVAGIYARNDVERGVHKSPANEIVRGAVGFEFLLNKAQQDVLNPEGINAFRFFEGRGYRLWGARTASSDPEWKYVGVRRYFQYLERSIERGTQWVVFENNNERLWANVRRTIEDFLFNEWNNGALMGLKPTEAYWVRCDRTTMTQNDIDNGRLICLIGVSPNKPAEFVIFRIGQWTADRKQ